MTDERQGRDCSVEPLSQGAVCDGKIVTPRLSLDNTVICHYHTDMGHCAPLLARKLEVFVAGQKRSLAWLGSRFQRPAEWIRFLVEDVLRKSCMGAARYARNRTPKDPDKSRQ